LRGRRGSGEKNTLSPIARTPPSSMVNLQNTPLKNTRAGCACLSLVAPRADHRGETSWEEQTQELEPVEFARGQMALGTGMPVPYCPKPLVDSHRGKKGENIFKRSC